MTIFYFFYINLIVITYFFGSDVINMPNIDISPLCNGEVVSSSLRLYTPDNENSNNPPTYTWDVLPSMFGFLDVVRDVWNNSNFFTIDRPREDTTPIIFERVEYEQRYLLVNLFGFTFFKHKEHVFGPNEFIELFGMLGTHVLFNIISEHWGVPVNNYTPELVNSEFAWIYHLFNYLTFVIPDIYMWLFLPPPVPVKPFCLTPLEAFKTDIYLSHFGILDIMYPSSGGYFEFNTLFLVIFILVILAIGFIMFSGKDLHTYFLIVNSYLTICFFYVSQLNFLLRGYFVSFLTTIILIGGFNIIGLFPYAGSFTAQIIVNLNFTFSLILGLIIVGFNINGLGFLYMFMPKNVPSPMIPVLFLIEVLSFLMRIFSMSIRLFSNMVAGHSLLHLLYEFVQFILGLVSGKKMLIIFALFPLVILYFWLFFELFVALLQAYVFVLLYLLYLEDVNKSH